MDEMSLEEFDRWLQMDAVGYNRPHGRKPKKHPRDEEHKQQVNLFQWISGKAQEHDELDSIYAVPNGSKRDERTGAKLKAEGLKAGVPDVVVAVARKGYHGLYIEMKVRYEDGKKNYPSPDQDIWIERLTRQGYLVVVCYSWVEAAKIIALYLGYEDLLEGL